MRSLLATIVCLVFFAPSLAAAQSLTPEQVEAFRSAAAHPAECARLRRQVDHYIGMQQRASALKDPMWTERMRHQIKMLRAMQASRCPQDLPVDTTAQAFQELLKIAAKGALTYFTFGAF